MTIREAIDEIKFGIDENENTGFYVVQTEAYKKAIEALEKQIPKKPVENREHRYIRYSCPVCCSSVPKVKDYSKKNVLSTVL